MKTQHIPCNNCGASLPISKEQNSLNCNYCGTSLKVVRGAESSHTEALKEIDERTKEMAYDIQVLRLQDELSSLDKSWMLKRPSIMLQGYSGKLSEPNPQNSLFFNILAAALLLASVFGSYLQGNPILFIFGLIPFILLLNTAFENTAKSRKYYPEKKQYTESRQRILDDLRSIYDLRLA